MRWGAPRRALLGGGAQAQQAAAGAAHEAAGEVGERCGQRRSNGRIGRARPTARDGKKRGHGGRHERRGKAVAGAGREAREKEAGGLTECL